MLEGLTQPFQHFVQRRAKARDLIVAWRDRQALTRLDC
jgi:hypothetical protein